MAQDLDNLQQILHTFGEVTGLRTNVAKSEIYGINCEVEGTQLADSFTGKIGQFPCKYLGLPLHIGRARGGTDPD